MYMLSFFCALFIIFVVGNALLKIIDRSRCYAGILERLMLSAGLGIGGIAVVQVYALFAHLELTRDTIFMLASPFIIFQLYRLFSLFEKTGFPGSRRIRDHFLRPGSIKIEMSISELLLIALIVFLCMVMIAACLLMPKYSFDSRACWGLTSKILFYRHTVFTADFRDQCLVHPSPLYPPLIPLVENFMFIMLGNLDEYLVKIIYALWYTALVVVLYVTQRRYFSLPRLHALIGTAAGACVPSLFVIYSGSVPSAYADFPFGCFYTTAVIYLFNYIRLRRRADIIIAAIFMFFCLLTKNEGMPLFFLASAVFLFDAIRYKYFGDKGTKRALFIFIAAPLIAFIPWLVVKSSITTPLGYNEVLGRTFSHFSSQLFIVPRIFLLTMREMFLNFKSCGTIWYIIIIAAIISFSRGCLKKVDRRIMIYLLILPFIYYIFIITPVYMTLWIGYDVPIDTEFEGASFERLRFHVLPLLVLFASIGISRFFTAGVAAQDNRNE